MTTCDVIRFDPVAPAAGTTSGGDPTGDTITAGSYAYIGTNGRLVGLATGVALEIKTPGGDWLRESEWTEDGSNALPSFGVDSSAGTVTANEIFYVGATSRFVALSNGVALEVKDAGGNWIRQREWTQ